MTWQPIDTAPKDQMVLVYGRACNFRLAYYDPHEARWMTIPGMWGVGRPTHWMPLPAPPDEAQQQTPTVQKSLAPHR